MQITVTQTTRCTNVALVIEKLYSKYSRLMQSKLENNCTILGWIGKNVVINLAAWQRKTRKSKSNKGNDLCTEQYTVIWPEAFSHWFLLNGKSVLWSAILFNDTPYGGTLWFRYNKEFVAQTNTPPVESIEYRDHLETVWWKCYQDVPSGYFFFKSLLRN